jgi:hypothetical protein
MNYLFEHTLRSSALILVEATTKFYCRPVNEVTLLILETLRSFFYIKNGHRKQIIYPVPIFSKDDNSLIPANNCGTCIFNGKLQDLIT